LAGILAGQPRPRLLTAQLSQERSIGSALRPNQPRILDNDPRPTRGAIELPMQLTNNNINVGYTFFVSYSERIPIVFDFQTTS